MKLGDLGEFQLIRRMSRGCLIRSEGIIKAIGDDAAVFRPDPRQVCLVTTDLLVERIHFLRDKISGRALGHKSLAVNLSDIAAMGGTPKEAFISIAIPEDCSLDYLDEFYDGLRDLAKIHDVNLLGGDTTGSKVDLIVNILIIGTAPEDRILYRHGARPGDVIGVTGPLGESRAGLHLLLQDIDPDTEALGNLVRAHQMPRPHLAEGRFLAEHGASAAIDVSDGLSSDLGHVLEESGAGARLRAGGIPVSASLREFCGRFGFDEPVTFALDGGEDYVLLCTVPPDRWEEVSEGFAGAFGRPLHAVGTVTADKGITLVHPDGRVDRVRAGGWDHFRSGVEV